MIVQETGPLLKLCISSWNCRVGIHNSPRIKKQETNNDKNCKRNRSLVQVVGFTASKNNRDEWYKKQVFYSSCGLYCSNVELGFLFTYRSNNKIKRNEGTDGTRNMHFFQVVGFTAIMQIYERTVQEAGLLFRLWALLWSCEVGILFLSQSYTKGRNEDKYGTKKCSYLFRLCTLLQ